MIIQLCNIKTISHGGMEIYCKSWIFKFRRCQRGGGTYMRGHFGTIYVILHQVLTFGVMFWIWCEWFEFGVVIWVQGAFLPHKLFTYRIHVSNPLSKISKRVNQRAGEPRFLDCEMLKNYSVLPLAQVKVNQLSDIFAFLII